MQLQTESHLIRFGTFELDLRDASLSKSGRSIRLQGQPFQILALLLENAGKIVTREEMRHKLWSDETFVEFDDALNTAVRKLRVALGDRADNPRFIETVPRRGYRFIAPVTLPSEIEVERPLVKTVALDEVDMKKDPPAKIPPDLLLRAANKARWLRVTLFVLAVSIVAAATIGLTWRTRRTTFHFTANDTVFLADFVSKSGGVNDLRRSAHIANHSQ